MPSPSPSPSASHIISVSVKSFPQRSSPDSCEHRSSDRQRVEFILIILSLMCGRVASLLLFVNIVSFRIDAGAPCHLSCRALYFVSSELVIFTEKTVQTRLLVTVILSAGETLEFCIQRAAGQGWRLDRTPAVERELTQKHDLVEIFQIFQTVTEAVSMGGRGGVSSLENN